MKGRRTPALDPIEAERRRVLTTLDIPALRAWMARRGGYVSTDDALVLQAAHEARAVDPTMPAKLRRESIAWLEEHHPESVTFAMIRHYPGEYRGTFRGPTYGRKPK